MTDLDLARLKALADGATPGPWRLVTSSERMRCGIDGADDSAVVWNSDKKWDGEETGIPRDDDAAYIAALSPDVVTALIARVERAEAALRELQVAAGTALEMLPPEQQEPGNPIADFLASIHRHCAETLSGDEPPQNLARTALAALEAS